jgi:hypothetical protein
MWYTLQLAAGWFIAQSKELLTFLDWNGQIPLSQRSPIHRGIKLF